MALRRDRKNLKYYIAELLILVLGISLSIVLNEWRVTKSERKVERQMLKQFHDNLVDDSTFLSAANRGVKMMMEAGSDLLRLTTQDAYTDTTAQNLVLTLNYTNFYPTEIGYEEMRSLGNSRLIQNKELLQELIELYETDYDIVAELTSLDKNFVLNDLMPHVNKNLPFARKLNFALLPERDKRRLMAQLMNDETRYLIQYGEIIKGGINAVFTGTLEELRKIIGMINEELEN